MTETRRDPNMTLDEGTKRAAVRLLEAGEKPEAIIEFIFGLGYMQGLLKMAKSQAARVDSAMRQML